MFKTGDFDILNHMFFTLNITWRNSLKRMQKLCIQSDRVARNNAKEHVELTEKKGVLKILIDIRFALNVIAMMCYSRQQLN